MKNPKYKFWFFGLLLATFVLNIIQAIYTGIISDEAYYKLFGENLSWGYFDHPPAVAILTRLSSLLFPGFLGIRFMGVVLHILTLFITWKIIDEKYPDTKKVFFFFLIVSSFVMFTVYGFVTTPDVPLLFFTALFLYAYKQFLKDASPKIIVLLGVVMAGLVYSKYQSALVIGFVVFSNLRLLKNSRFWLAGILGIFLLIPHFYWQFDHNFPTFQYQLIDRATEFRWLYIIEYIPHTFAVFNPFVFGAVLYIIFKYRPVDSFERALYFLIIGFVLFFWVMAIRGHVQPQWTVASTIPMIILLYNRIKVNKKLEKYAIRFLIPTLLILMAGRVLIVENDFITTAVGFEKNWLKGQLIRQTAGDLPVVFYGSFQESSKYRYFTSEIAFPLSSIEGRLTQFDIWQSEKKYHNKPVFVCDSIFGRSKKIYGGGNTIHGFVSDSLQTVNRMIVDFETPSVPLYRGDTVTMQISVQNPYSHSINFNHTQFPVTVLAVFNLNGKRTFQPVRFETPTVIIGAGNILKRKVTFVIPKLKTGRYQFCFSLSTCLCKPLNSKLVKIKVE